jgi:uncharacterized RDD family membrane protein YckC
VPAVREVVALAALLAFCAYHALSTTKTGSTLGKRAWKLSVVDVATGRPPTLVAAGGRLLFWVALGVVLSLATPRWVGSALLWALLLYPLVFDPNHRGLHDRLAGTMVVEGLARPAEPTPELREA